MFSLFGRRRNEADEPAGNPVDIRWMRNAKGQFFNMIRLDTLSEGLRDKGGVYVIWHGGVKPNWLYVGSTSDLGRQLDPLIDDPRFEGYYAKGDVYTTWAFVPQNYRHGVVRYLTEHLVPAIENPAAGPLCRGPDRVVPIAVFAPGREPKRVRVDAPNARIAWE